MQDLFVKEQLSKASENFSKDLPAIIKSKETPKASQLETTKGISSNELFSRQLEKERALATEKNKSKQVDNPKVMTTGENFNKLAPIIIDVVKNNTAGTGKEAIGKGKKEEVQSTAEIPNWPFLYFPSNVKHRKSLVVEVTSNSMVSP